MDTVRNTNRNRRLCESIRSPARQQVPELCPFRRCSSPRAPSKSAAVISGRFDRKGNRETRATPTTLPDQTTGVLQYTSVKKDRSLYSADVPQQPVRNGVSPSTRTTGRPSFFSPSNSATAPYTRKSLYPPASNESRLALECNRSVVKSAIWFFEHTEGYPWMIFCQPSSNRCHTFDTRDCGTDLVECLVRVEVLKISLNPTA